MKSSEDWDGTKAKARENNNSLMDYNMPRPQTDIDQKADVNEIVLSKLQIEQSDLKEEMTEVTDSLTPPPPTEMPEDMVGENANKELSEVERKLQQEEESYEWYQRVYMGQLSEEEESNMESDSSSYSYCVWRHKHS